MREIKFRAWSKRSNCMVTIWGIHYVDFNGEQIASTFAVNPVFGGEYILKAEDMELMQYTGAKDRDNVEIFEGDILEEGGAWGRFEVHWDGRWCKFRLDCSNVSTAIQYPEWNRAVKMKVIGNIHANPELLKHKTTDNNG